MTLIEKKIYLQVSGVIKTYNLEPTSSKTFFKELKNFIFKEKKKKRKYKENDKGSSKRHRGGKKFSIKTRKNKKI